MYEMVTKAMQADRERIYRTRDEKYLCALPNGITIARKKISLVKWTGWLLILITGK
jgi:hypothetical protein